MSITDELRECALSFKNINGVWSSIGEKLDHIDAEHERLMQELYEVYIDSPCEDCPLKGKPACADCPIFAREVAVIGRMHELGVEVDG